MRLRAFVWVPRAVVCTAATCGIRNVDIYRVIKFWNTFCFYIIYKIHHTSVPDKRDMEKKPVSCSTLILYSRTWLLFSFMPVV